MGDVLKGKSSMRYILNVRDNPFVLMESGRPFQEVLGPGEPDPFETHAFVAEAFEADEPPLRPVPR